MDTFCCMCTKEIVPESKGVLLAVDYSEPAQPSTQFMAIVCADCANEAARSNESFSATEALINARIVRLQNPDKSFYP